MKSLMFLLALFSSQAMADTKVIALSADKPAGYAVGENATLSAQLFTQPDNAAMELDLVGSLDGVELPATRVTPFAFFSTYPVTTGGEHVWSVSVYLQDARLARDLKATIGAATAQIDADNLALQNETDPAKIAALEADIIYQQRLVQASSGQLNSIRSRIYGPISLAIQAN